jgi:hypothetical protein
VNDPVSFYIQDGERLVSTELTRGPWSSVHQHGGPPAALLARACAREAGPGMRLVRILVEFEKPVPMTVLEQRARLVRGGKRVRTAEAVLLAGGVQVAHAAALFVREEPKLAEVFPEEPAPPLPDAGASTTFPFFRDSVGYHTAMELRFTRGGFGHGPSAAWFRLRVPLVAGETPSAAERVIAAADSTNGISWVIDVKDFTFANPDLAVYLARPLEGEWIHVDAATRVGGGSGVAEARLADQRGTVGRSVQSLLVERRM